MLYALAASTLAVATAHVAVTPKPTMPAQTTISAPKAAPSSGVTRHCAHHRRLGPTAVERVAIANRVATQEPQAQSFIDAVQVYPFSDGAIYQIYTAPGAVTDIALQPGENLVAVAAGDTVRWVIGDTTSGSGSERRTHVLAKPFSTGLATNLLITTDRRSYHLQLTATSRTAMAALSWSYPTDQLIALRHAAEKAEAAAPVAQGLEVDQLHFNYVLTGDWPTWRPLRAFDDGRQTFVEFPTSIAVGEAPPLFAIGPKGEADLVNYRVRGRYYVVDRIFDAAELRLGTKKRQVVHIARVDESAMVRKGHKS